MAPSIASSSATAPASRKISARSSTRPSLAAMEAEPFSGVAMPLDVEAVGADPVEASEGRVELLAEIFREAGAVALDEAILGAMPFAEDIDGIVELRRPD